VESKRGDEQHDSCRKKKTHLPIASKAVRRPPANGVYLAVEEARGKA
jgi:hypothetical protein